MLMTEPLKQLLVLLADGKFHSGTQLSLLLGISRAAVWKHLHALAELGIDLHAVSGKGYKLAQPWQCLDQQQIIAGLNSQALVLLNKLEIHDILDSTNNYLLNQAKLGGASGLVCLSEYQTAGKGRRGRHWHSPFGQNIYLSLLWHYQQGPAAISGLSLALGVGVMRALQQLGVTTAGLKWPNDIFFQQRKLGGILVEVSGEADGPCFAVIGLGLNFYLSAIQAVGIAQPWIDMTTILGETAYQQRNRLIALLLNELLPITAGFEEANLQDFISEWQNYDCMLGKQVDIGIADYKITGTVAGINQDGLLILNTDDGQQRCFASGEVSLRQQ